MARAVYRPFAEVELVARLSHNAHARAERLALAALLPQWDTSVGAVSRGTSRS